MAFQMPDSERNKMKGKLEEQFLQAIEGIREYATKPEVQLSSQIKKDFDSYRQLVGLGVDVLEPLKEIIGKESEIRLYVLNASCDILRKMPGHFKIPDEISGNLPRMEMYVRDTIDNLRPF